ncbi:hypothetical protein NCER_100669 [Vairimorpha ceranae BRL01]|uniref:Uncharacterized protein n=2 Tax=Vairimorpha ceranae TaxID=40302 RepID=C4V864_VAIC1|nr:abc-type multidrug transport atpase and permease component [Vairimorpha ceranae]EEQ82582.1 hypothetical protein NCER_100669 [Vairimorpha ceranae BRL01]KAF5140624.1 hypothetical protein G9O61_00g011200 [Vairimorpha ceranae]KKO74754.1 abc-type multidrug transport atpase and permease component [Vairimorpha ceranae]
MSKFKLVYLPQDGKKNCIFTNINLKKLSSPITISREKPLEEDVVFNARKRSEVVEYEAEEYLKLKKKESCPILVEDADSLSFLGKLQDLGSNSSCYFTFIREGNTVYITPINKWYRFTQKIPLKESVNEDEITKVISEKVIHDGSNESDREEIDFDDQFQDDDGEEYNFEVQKQKKLTTEGKKLRNLVDNLEKGEDEAYEEHVKEDVIKIETKQRVKNVLTDEKIRECFVTPLMSVKELIRKLKTSFHLDNDEKILLKKFINESCVFEIDKLTGEKQLKLKR